MTALVIVPGWLDSGPTHWQTLWEKSYPGSLRVEQDDWEHPVCSDWVARLNQTLGEVEAGEDVVIVAHSLGCATTAHWAAHASLLEQKRVRGALLVAPPDLDDPRFSVVPARGFSPLPDWNLPFPVTVVASADDPYCMPERARAMASAWGARFVALGAAGHINADSGLGQWEFGSRLLQRLILDGSR
ncbi:RBBP9/YdeN family alpha/beta hydrolase [Paludibacterium yongneupense]|uniref:RBBP9/YdeN family alpha/beta hydrolase n=1 Tax=Paludibacterium yongneupense TaxID=400061 RepID=UPI000421B3DE|nr:alpha/beta hydrolase [Paludibacterium yongneupense]